MGRRPVRALAVLLDRAMMKSLLTASACALLLNLILGGCTSLPDPANRAAANGGIGAGIGALIGGIATGGGIGLPIGIGVGAAFGAIAGALAPPSPPLVFVPIFPW